MPATSPPNATDGKDAHDQIQQMRAQLDALMADKVEPALHEAAHRATHAARRAGKMASDEADQIADLVRQRPFAALAASAALGFVIARLTR